MPHRLITLRALYEPVLAEFLARQGEESLVRAHGMGREAIENGLGCLDVVRVHEESFNHLLELNPAEPILPRIALAAQFLSHSLSPYEMTHRGFQESINSLRVKANDLALMNTKLEAEILERQLTEKALRESEFRYRALVDTARDVIYTVAPSGMITSLNPAFEQLTGWSRKGWMGKNFAPLVHPEDLPLALDILQRVLRGESPLLCELRIRSANREYLTGEFVSTPQFHDNAIVGVLGIARDISRRKQAEEQLHKNEMQLAAAQQIAHLGSWEWDIPADRMVWSEELYRMYGVEPSPFHSTFASYLQRVHPGDRPLAQRTVEFALATRSAFQFEHRVIRSDDAERVVETRGEIVLGASNKVVRIMGTTQDITDRKHKDESLRQLARRVVDAQEEERRRIARELHDDICQRLSATKLRIDALEDTVPKKNKAMSRELARVRRQIGTTIKEVRSISMNLRPSMLDDLGLAFSLQLLCREFEKHNHVKVDLTTEGILDNGLSVHAETALYRITQEALANIAKHAHAKRVSVGVKRDRDALRLIVRDDGKGFESRHQAAHKHQNGMGLFSMRERALLLGGTLDLTSKLNRGTSVILTVPITSTKSHEKNTTPPGGRP